MTLTVAPPRIETSDFSAGWCPDLEVGAIPPNGLLEVQNLLPDAVTGQPQTREGYKRVAGFSVPGYTVKSLHPFNTTTGDRYLIAVCTSGVDVQVWAYDLKDGSAAQVSPALKVWNALDGIHYGFANGDVFYGGSEKDPMYSWDGTTWTDDASDTTHPAHSATKAYRKGDTVSYGGSDYTSVVDWRETDWQNSSSYAKGDKVSITVGGELRTYKARIGHDSSGTNAPGLGTAESGEHWTHLRMKLPVDANGDPSDHWVEIADAPVTSVAVFHGHRMWGRHDNRQRAVYNEQANLAPDESLESVAAAWGPTKWRISNLSTAAGFQDFTTQQGDEIVGFYSYGRNLLVFKQKTTHVITGIDSNTWIPRQLGSEGSVSSRSFCELDGIVYFVSQDGFNMTDGTEIRPAPGSDKVQDYLRNVISWDGASNVVMWAWQNMVWIAYPTGGSKTNNRVLVYDPATGSFWKLNMAVSCVAINNINGVDHLFFGVPTKIGTYEDAAYAWTGVAHESTSTMTWTASPVHVVENMFINAGFEKPFATGWEKTHEDYVFVNRTPESAYQGQYGLEVKNSKRANNPQGIQQELTFPVGDNYKISWKVRRTNWKKWPDAAPDVAIYNDGSLEGGTFQKLGHGWWRITATIAAGAASTHTLSLRVSPDRTVQVDTAMVFINSEDPPDFDGDAGEDQQPPDPVETPGDPGDPANAADTGTFAGGNGLIMQYAHPDSNYTDDTAQTAYATQGITWWLHTAWFSFSSAKEIRRTRRTWALVRGAVTAILRGYRNFDPQPIYEVTKTSAEGDEATYFEGRKLPDAHCISFAIAGTSAPAAVLGIAADTQFRRFDYHHGS